ncbi:hypothetical protein R3P38DRAFT_3276391 [Favolaschia claudopus]|uniref:Uncharacterized protein n=1 Tax=Favolaschia claudopus TaxID=2862362 RepID=A0AAW0ATZ5_9AGAR
MSVEGYVRKRHTPVIRPVPGHMNDGVNQIPVSYLVASSRRALRPSSLASMNGGARKNAGRRRPPRNPAHFQLIPFPQLPHPNCLLSTLHQCTSVTLCLGWTHDSIELQWGQQDCQFIRCETSSGRLAGNLTSSDDGRKFT